MTMGNFDDENEENCLTENTEQDPAKANPFEYALKARHYIQQYAGI